MFNGIIHYKWAIFNSYVKSPEGMFFFSLTQIPGLRCPTNENDAIRACPETQAQQPHVSIDRWGPLDR
jgi:hypothetical protein